MIDGNETPLDISWLKSRESYDRTARSPEVLDAFLAETDGVPLKLADLGCGTGSNALFLAETLKARHVQFHLVEREAYLLEEARRRIREKNAGHFMERDHAVYLEYGECRQAFYFYNEPVRDFMRRHLELQVVCAGALFDLFTEDEFDDLLKALKPRRIALYGVLNYCGTRLFPACAEDERFVALYERHMSRLLHKGRPMGKKTMAHIQDGLNSENGWQLTVSNSNWVLGVGDAEFISRNLDFYDMAVPELLRHQEERTAFREWMAEKRRMIAQRKLEMRVYHQDFFARCL